MAEIVSSPSKTNQSQQQANPEQPIPNPNQSIASPAMTSSSLSDLSQQGQIDASGYQRTTNPAMRMSQQFAGAGMSASAMRLYAGSGQMNFAGGAQQQSQLLTRAGMMGQLPMLPGQTPHYLQPQMINNQQRQKGMVQSTQFNATNVGQALSGMQAMGMMGQMNTLGMNQIRANGALSYAQQQQQRFTQMRPQQITSQSSLPSPQQQQKMTPQQLLHRANPLSGMTAQQQQVLKQLPPPQQQALLQQLSQAHQQKHQQLQQIQLQQLQLQQQQQNHQQSSSSSSPRVVVGPTIHRTVSLPGSQQESSAKVTDESSKQVLGKRKIQDLVSQVDPAAKVSDEVEDMLLGIADDFIDSVTSFACNLAKHRKSNKLEPKDVLLHLEQNWQLPVPGYSRDKKQRTTVSPAEAQKRRMEMVRMLLHSQQVERENQQGGARVGLQMQMPLMANNNNNINIINNNMMGNENNNNNMMRSSSGTDGQFSLPSVAMMQKAPRF